MITEFKKDVVYTNQFDEQFKIEYQENENMMYFQLVKNNGDNILNFDSKKEVDEFCHLLQEKKNEIWN